MGTERSIAPLVAQFVPLKVDTGSPEWGAWASKYPSEGNGIPKIFVIRADGTKMYGQTGALNGNDLPLMMQSMLQQSGRIFTDQQIVALEAAVENAKKADADGDLGEAVRSLVAAKKLGTLGELRSYAAAAIEADQLVVNLTEKGKAALAAADSKLTDTTTNDTFAGALAYAEADRIFGPLPTMTTELATATRKYGRMVELKESLAQAQALDRARLMVATPRSEKKGIEALQRLVERFPGQPVAELALADLKQVGTATDAPTEPEFRTFSDSTGAFEVEAQLLGLEDGSAILKKKDGQTIRVPIERLSEADQEFVKSQK